ncbi:MAG: hypothetical protein ETSY1_28810 [Candidatus Entotheonella factor]|uniref:Rieske domain-containing protein n=1 Tax=Entotheonella factor TaxID=1429438 RepID=W4LEW9_ENTF1|nr:MAG: hypothetical protein ETSY1_28810 [Candidatus Entotheonella factor]
MDYLRNCWLPAVWSKDLRSKPVPIQVLDTRLVVFRNQDGQAVVMEDRCPHRGVALSDGYAIDGGIMCAYHGWRFDGKGTCVKIPSLLPEEPLPDFRVPCYPTCEQEGTVWFTFSLGAKMPDLPAWRHLNATYASTMIEIEGNYIHLMENLVDNPHAGFIHAGLIRGEPTQRVQAEITETPSQIRIQTIGEKHNDSLLFKLLGKRGEEVNHIEEYLGPNQMVSTYEQRGYFAGVQSFIVPISEHRTRWFFRTFLKFGPMTALVFPIYRRVVHRILSQDAAVVKKVDEQDQLWPGRRTHSTRSDTPSVMVARAARSYAKDGPRTDFTEHTRIISYML